MPSKSWKRSFQRIVITEKAPTRGLLRDCDIFANLPIAFVPSSSAQSAQRPPLGVGRMEWDTAAARAASAVCITVHNVNKYLWWRQLKILQSLLLHFFTKCIPVKYDNELFSTLPLLLLPETKILLRLDGNIKKSAPVIGNNIQKPDVMKMKIMKRGRKKDPRWRIVIVLQNTD